MKLGRRGSVLVHVLITSIVCSVIATGLLRMMMFRYQATTRVEESSRAKKYTEAALHRIVSGWNAAGGGQYCADGPGGSESWTCTGTPGTAIGNCACNCNVTITPPSPLLPVTVTVTAAAVGGRCALTITSTP